MIFIILWAISFVLILLAMCLDNIFWVSSSGEWNTSSEVKGKSGRVWKGPVNKYTKKQLVDYIVNYRIREVITDRRDLIPAIISSLLMTIILTLGG